MLDAPEPGDGLLITRVFDAPREQVWSEWTTPEAFADWYGGPDFPIPVESVSMDVRPGGTWRATMLAGPEREIQWEGEYVDVVEPERLAFTVTDQPGERARPGHGRAHGPGRRPHRDADDPDRRRPAARGLRAR